MVCGTDLVRQRFLAVFSDFNVFRNCSHCKTLRKATKRLSLARLPPVLLIHLKRFSVKGHFTEKIETTVDFPLKSLDLTNYMPPPLPPGVGGAQHLLPDDPRAQSPPYRYDLYGVTNHFGTLSSGHCQCDSTYFHKSALIQTRPRHGLHRIARWMVVL